MGKLFSKGEEEKMLRRKFLVYSCAAVALAALIATPAVAQEKKAEKAKAKAEKVAGDIGLLDTEKNYMIVVTKEGKLVTVDFNAKTKVTAMVPEKAKMGDIGLGSAASVQYTEKGGKNYLTAIEYIAKKGGD
jgi:hypothetical protein